jgi:hypothetical protein
VLVRRGAYLVPKERASGALHESVPSAHVVQRGVPLPTLAESTAALSEATDLAAQAPPPGLLDWITLGEAVMELILKQ